jgi:uncharacterized RDD family membrane protein YckC
MKCPKCGYLGFEEVDRCRNCGYEFLLAPAEALDELPLRSPSVQLDTLDDYTLIDGGRATTAGPLSAFGSEADSHAGRADSPRRFRSAALSQLADPELPLFDEADEAIDDTPLITKASPPRAPLAVRRATPEAPRPRAESPRIANLDLSLDPDAEPGRRMPPGERGRAPEWFDPDASPEPAGVFPRVAATLIDAGILFAVDLAVIYFTLQICGITVSDLGLIPKGPLIAFLMVQNVGYLVAFTAGGQTLGKMAAGIKVVAADSREPLDVPRAMKRTVAWLLLACPAGLGFVTALFNRDHRGLHDRFAGTRVVRASA